MIHLAIVEDDEGDRDRLIGYLERLQAEREERFRITCFGDGDEIVENYSSDYDIILMDIQMRFMDGMTAAERIRRLDEEVVLLFITNMTQYAIRGYAVDAMDYMVKPVEYFAFSQKLGRALERVRHRKERFIFIQAEEGMQKLNVDGIYYVESQGHHLIYKTRSGEFTTRGIMRDLEAVMKPYWFFRSNKGYLVNMRYVDGIREGCCIVHGEALLISRAKRKPFMEALANYMSEVMS